MDEHRLTFIYSDQGGFTNAFQLNTPMNIKRRVSNLSAKISDTINGRTDSKQNSQTDATILDSKIPQIKSDATFYGTESGTTVFSRLSERRSQMYDEVASNDFDLTQWELAVQVTYMLRVVFFIIFLGSHGQDEWISKRSIVAP